MLGHSLIRGMTSNRCLRSLPGQLKTEQIEKIGSLCVSSLLWLCFGSGELTDLRILTACFLQSVMKIINKQAGSDGITDA